MSFFYANQLEVLNQGLTELQIGGKINVSFEFFPPNSIDMKNTLFQSIERLSPLKPNFISVTYNNKKCQYHYVRNLISEIKERTGLNVAPHMTCINSTIQEMQNMAQDYWYNGIRHIVALRGDKITGMQHTSMYASDLVLLLKQVGDFDISIAAYPEVHPEAKSAQSDLINLKKKIDAGANRAITQFFFHIESYLRFRDRCVSMGIDAEIIPGILPISNFRQLKRFISMTNVKVPSWMTAMFNGLDTDKDTCKLLGAAIAMDMVKILSREGVKNFHFYTMNHSELTYAICHILKGRDIESH